MRHTINLTKGLKVIWTALEPWCGQAHKIERKISRPACRNASKDFAAMKLAEGLKRKLNRL